MVDTNFNTGDGVDLSVYSIALQPNGQVVIAGNFTSFNDVDRINVARLNADGSRDDKFDPGTNAFGGPYPYVNAIALLSNGQLFAGGSFTNTAATNFSRLNSNGNLDSSFTPNVSDIVNALVVQTNGGVIIGGFFTNVNGQAHAGLARFGSNGALDQTFNPALSGAFGAAYALSLQNDGKILIGGSFTNINGSSRTNIARLNPDGTLDQSFQPAVVSGGQLSPAVFYAVTIDAQGRVLVGGDFTAVNGQVRTNLARFNNDGSLDPNFYPAAGTDFAVTCLALEPYGKVLVGGYFNKVNGVINNYIAPLNDDGTLDPTFNTGSGASDVVYSIVLQPDGKILCGGAFTDINNITSYGIARLLNVITAPAPVLVNPSLGNHVFRVSVATVSGKSYTLQFKNDLTNGTWNALSPVAGDGTVKILTDNNANVVRRFYRVSVQ